MRFKRLLALLLAAALALSLLAGCSGGQQSAAQALLKLLDGKYPNISIEIDPDLEADLRQAISQAEAENAGDDDAVIRAALEKLVGSTVTFRNLGDGQQGDTTFDLVFYAGTDPDKAAQAAYSQWNIVFANVPDDGKYGTGLAMVETDNGIWMLVKATVEKAGTEDKAEPVTLKSLSVTGPSQTEYIKGQPFNPAGMTVTAHYSDGSFKPIAAGEYTIVIDDKEVSSSYQFDRVGSHTLKVKYNEMVSTNSVSIWVADENGYHEESGTYVVTGSDGLQNLFKDKWSDARSATIILEKDQIVTGTFGDNDQPFMGILQSEDGKKVTITLSSESGQTRTQGLFNYIGNYSNPTGTVKDLTIQVNSTIRNSEDPAQVGAVAGNNFGTIENCRVEGGTIQGVGNSAAIDNSAGGVVGYNHGGTVTGCFSTCTISGAFNTGGVVGHNYGGTVNDCYSTGTVSCGSAGGSAGGVVGRNSLYSSVTGCYHAVGEVSGVFAGGVVGWNDSSTVTACYSTNPVTGSSNGRIGGVVGNNSDGGTVTACYWSGYDGDGIGYDETGKYANSSEYFNQHTNMVNGDWTNIAGAMNAALASNNYPAYWKDNVSSRPTLNWE